MVMSGLSAFLIWFDENTTGNLVLSCIFGAVSTMGFNALDCLGAELFPTGVRLETLLYLSILYVNCVVSTCSFIGSFETDMFYHINHSFR